MFQIVFLFTLIVAIQCNHQCSQIKDICQEEVKFWLATTHDSNKNWIAETGVEHSKNSSFGWKVLVENESSDCEGEKYCRMVATLTANCKGSMKHKDEGYIRESTGLYKIHEKISDWNTAKMICESEGGHLAILDSEEEKKIISNLKPDSESFYFIGFSDPKKNRVFLDLLGNPVKNFWGRTQPNNFKNNSYCGGIIIYGGIAEMNDIPCTFNFPFICEKSKGSMKHKDEGYIKESTGLYKIHENISDWNSAKMICESEGGHLAILDSKEERKMIYNLMKSSPYKVLLIGISDPKNNRVFLDLFGNPVKNFWGPEKPNNYGGKEYCGNIYIPETIVMNDLPCSDAHPFICEKSIHNDEDYIRESTGLYKIHEKPSDWNKAKIICESEGGHLAILDSEEERQIIYDLMNSSSHKVLLIGISDPKKNQVFLDLFGNPVKNFWGPEKPNNYGGKEYCGNIYIPETIVMDDLPCTDAQHFICEKSIYNDEDYIRESTGLYKIHEKPSDWNKAKIICESEGGHLAILDSEEERNIIFNLKPNSNKLFLIGFSDHKNNRVFLDLFGNPVKNYWRSGEPNNYRGKESCGSIFISETDTTMNDIPCDADYPFICEKSIL